MAQDFCPYLGSCGKDGTRGPAQDYPSFENQCFALELIDPLQDELASQLQLLLTDQATYCLARGHKLCPRYQTLHGRQRATTPAPVSPGTSSRGAEGTVAAAPEGVGAYPNPGLMDELAYEEMPERGPRPGFWLGLASLIFVFVLCGGSLATYVGWQMVGQGLVPLSQRLQALANPPAQEQVFLLVTPTPATLAQVSLLPTLTPTPTPDFNFPAAVTPTPIALGEGINGERIDDEEGSNQQIGPVVITTPTPGQFNPAEDGENQENPGPAPADPALATAVSAPVIITTPNGLQAPTRRPTPLIIEAPTSTSGDPLVIVVTATPTPTFPEAKVTFRAAHQLLPPRDCTTLFWEVENVRAVFLDNEGVAGKGERRVCIQYVAQTHNLSVLRLDGVQEDHPVTIDLLVFTPTPTATPTATPVVTPTPTWTPVGGVAFPTAEAPRQSVTLTIDGGNQRLCYVGQPCETIVQVNNNGDLADEIFVDVGKQGPWQVELCRPDFVCGETSVSVGVGAGDRRPVVLRAVIPAESQGQSYSFEVVGSSGNSGRTVRSNPVLIVISIE
jgi:hypothetical protein